MKTKLDQKNAISTLTLGVSAGVGALASKGVMSIAPATFRKPIIRGVLGAMALVAASTIQGQGTLEKASQGALLGVGIQQTLESALSFVTAPVLGDAPTVSQKFFAGALAGVDGASESFVLPPASLQRRSASMQTVGTGGFAAA